MSASRRKPIERTGLKPPTLAQVRAWERKPRKPISPRGAKARREKAALAAFRAELLARSRGVCEAHLRAPTRWPDICGTRSQHAGTDPHHIWPEDRDEGRHDPARGLLLCRRAHRWTHSFPVSAAAAGLLRPPV